MTPISTGTTQPASCSRPAWLRPLLLGITLIAIVVLGISTVFRAGPYRIGGKRWGSEAHRTDFTVYREAGRAVLDGTNVYEAHNIRGWYFMYLPIFAVAMVPFALVSTFGAVLVWYVLSVLMLGHTVHLSGRLARRLFPGCQLADIWLYAATVLLVLVPVVSGISRGQASLLVTYLVTLAVTLYFQRRPVLASLCLAGSIVMKVFPALLVVYFLVKRQWTMLAATAVWLVLLVWLIPACVFGMRGNQALLREWATTIALPATAPDQAAGNTRYSQMISPYIDRNQSVQAVTIRWLVGPGKDRVDTGREQLARRVATVINLGLLLVSAWACARGRAETDQPTTLLQQCVIILLMLFLSPVSWSHNYTVLALPAAVIIAASGKYRACRVALIVFVAASLLDLAVPLFHVRGALLAGTVGLWVALVAVLTGSRGPCLPESRLSPPRPPKRSKFEASQMRCLSGRGSVLNET
jgi:hypothetical protein